jgi:hypothetical protein
MVNPARRDYFKLFLWTFLALLSIGPLSYGAGLYNLGAFWHPRITFGKTWTWVSGASTVGQNASYGTKGTGSTSNVPGARVGNALWVDGSGNIWLFGGLISGGYGTNDYWEFSPGTSQWTWVSGSSNAGQTGVYGTQGTGSTSNIPTARGGPTSWSDSSGNFWLFGGINGLSPLNDLWEYTPGNSQWTWTSGASTASQNGKYGTKGTGSTANVPGARSGTASWVDGSGNFWFFGGSGLAASGSSGGNLNDLWEYVPGTSTWTWITGASTLNQKGTYGTQGTGSTSNIPGARDGSCTWKDSSGNFWLFGGFGYDSVGGTAYTLNDVWKFAPGTSQWTWVSGSKTANAVGSYGNLGIASSTNAPPARASSGCWQDSAGNFWLYGGYSTVSDQDELDDVWMYSPTSQLWTWIAGPDVSDVVGTYGTEGVANSSNYPGQRDTPAVVLSSSGTLWFFGGDDSVGEHNDLWKAQ